MKKTLIILLAVAIFALSLASCTADKGTESQSTSTDASAQTSATEITENSEKITVNSDFYQEQSIILLQQSVFEAYKAENGVVGIDSTLNYYMESIVYDEESKTAVVQMPCMETGRGPKWMTLTFTKAENGAGWEKQRVEYTEKSNNTNVVPLDDAFYRNHYKAVQNTAFKFFRAYVMADYQTACSLIDSLDNPCLEYFNSNKGTLKTLAGFAVQINRYEVDESGKNGTVYVDVWHEKDPTSGNEGIDYMVLTIKIKEITAPNGKSEIQYCVSHYDFDT